MSTATLTSKGQITVPKEVREDLGLGPGSKLMFIRIGAGQYRILPQTGNVMDLAGLLHDPDREPLTLDAIEEAIADGWVESGLRGSPGHEHSEPM